MSLKVSSVSVRIEQLKKYNYNINNHATKFVCSCINSPWNVKANKGVNFMSLFIKKTFLKTFSKHALFSQTSQLQTYLYQNNSKFN